jgi:hypothetical protein
MQEKNIEVPIETHQIAFDSFVRNQDRLYDLSKTHF